MENYYLANKKVSAELLNKILLILRQLNLL